MSKSKAKPRTNTQVQNRAAVLGEPARTTAGAEPATALALARKLPEGIILKRRLQLPSLVIKKVGEIRFLAIADAVRASKVPGKLLKEPIKLGDGTMKTHEDPANIVTAGDVMTGEVYTFLLPAVVRTTFEQEYPDGSYVGKTFMVECLGKRDGKRHTDFSVAEVDVSGLRDVTADDPGA